MWKLAFLVFLVFSWDEVKAFDLGKVETVGIHTVSYHDPDYNFANFNPGVYVVSDRGWVAGIYANSYSRMTYYTGWVTPEWYRLSATIAVAHIETGPDRFPYRGLELAIVPAVRLFTQDSWSAKLAFMPKINPNGQDIFHFAFERSI